MCRQVEAGAGDERAVVVCMPAAMFIVQVMIYTRKGGNEVVWDVQWTGGDGTAMFFLVSG